MATTPLIEIREPGRPPRRMAVDRSLEIGREGTGVALADVGVSRRHLKLLPSPLGLSVVDLGSRNGTMVNGIVITGRTVLEPGDLLRLGGTEIVVVGRSGAGRPRPAQAEPITASSIPAPPRAPVVAAVPSGALTAARWLFKGSTPPTGSPLFRTYTELPRRIPQPVWQAIRAGSVLAYLTLCVAMFVWPTQALFTLFRVIVPLLPLLFFVAPGLWRNICPLAAANQSARVFGFSKGATTPKWLQQRGYLIAITLFFVAAGARLVLFNSHAAATGVLLLATIFSAFVAGVAFKGKSGWCSSICPLLPLQRVYGQTPLVLVANTHCNPCVACTKNCYDFKPQPAYQADLHDPDPRWSAPRRLFVAALPGFVLGFFTLLSTPSMTDLHLYGRLAVFVAVSIGSFFVLSALFPLADPVWPAVYGAAALNVFYYFSATVLAGAIATMFGADVSFIVWPIRIIVAAMTVVWISRSYWTSRRYEQEAGATRQVVPLTLSAPRSRSATTGTESSGAAETADRPVVCFAPDGAEVSADAGMSLLEVAERAGRQIEAGCRMGVCGADPVAVLGGSDCLSAPDEEELSTLRRLGLAESTRMACCARLQGGTVQVKLTPEPGSGAGGSRPAQFDRSITSIVVLGNGIAGVTAADFARRGHPDCEIHVVGSESHVLYNRMGISRLVYGRSAMTGLFLLAEDWYAEKDITAWLNTIATSIDPFARRVQLGTGDVLVYDRLILATGSSGVIPKIERFGAPGSFVLRSAADAMEIRAFAQRQGCRSAVVAGGGLLGLEAAFAMHELGLRVTVLERGSRLMSRQIDPRCSELVHAHFARIGIHVLYEAESRSLLGSAGIEAVTLTDGRTVRCEVFLACVGIRPNAALAERVGIAVNRGVLVDDRMQTSAAGVFAAGDVAEHDGLVLGLWPIAAKQGEVAAVNALGGDARLHAEIPATILKGVGLDLSCIGRVAPEGGDEVIALEDPRLHTYRRLIVSRGVLVGALVLGHQPEDLAAATAAVKKRQLLDAWALAELRAGRWGVLKQPGRVTAGAGAGR